MEGAAAELDRLSAAVDSVRLTVDQARTDAAEASQKIDGARPPPGLDELAARAEELRDRGAAAEAQLEKDRAGAARAADRLAAGLDTLPAMPAAPPLRPPLLCCGAGSCGAAWRPTTPRPSPPAAPRTCIWMSCYGAAQKALYEAPCDLEEAGRRVAAYQQCLRTHGQGGSG